MSYIFSMSGDTAEPYIELNPTVPLAFDIGWTAMVAVSLAPTAIAVVSVVRTRHARTRATLWWRLFVIAVPVLGSSAWFWPRDRRESMS